MKTPAHSWWQNVPLALLLAWPASGCGGQVDLGGRPSTSTHVGGAGGAGSSPVGNDNVSQPVAKLADDFAAGSLAVAGDYLYLGGWDGHSSGLYRCQKRACGGTLERVDSTGGFNTLQVYDMRLGVVRDTGTSWIGSYALPSLSDPQTAIVDLPNGGPFGVLFEDGFVYWSLPEDGNFYRCGLPSCPAGPEQIGHLEAADWSVSATGDQVFWSDASYIYRAGEHGQAPTQRLEPDEVLSESAVSPDELSDVPSLQRVLSVTASAGMLYAALTDAESVVNSASKPGCHADCSSRLVRWPATGGPREDLLQVEKTLRKVFVFGDEMAWLSIGVLAMGNLDAATLSTCRIADCAATRRDLGLVKADLRGLVADETDFYWLEMEAVPMNGSLSLLDRQIRRAPRSPH